MSDPGRLILFASCGALPQTVLQLLLDHGIPLAALVLPGFGPAQLEPGLYRGQSRHPLVRLAIRHGLEIVYLPRTMPDAVLGRLAELGVPTQLSVCFPYRLPVARLGAAAALNLHPSLLPAWRGPAPLFWQLRCGERNTGISLHHMDPRYDTGAIVAQRRIGLPAGAALDRLERRLARAGVELVLDALARRSVAGGQTQDEEHASHQPAPGAGDWIVMLDWDIDRAHRFLGAFGASGRARVTVAGVHCSVWSPVQRVALDTVSAQDYKMTLNFRGGALEFHTEPLRMAL